ncbi:MAG: hypothetical protein SCM96_15265 [Acidobacteriota bacterium]|nr:hypothetical protein [Acidobacteriota bacterium]
MFFPHLMAAAQTLDTGLVQGMIHSLLALSVIITLLSLNFPDLTIEGSFPFGAALGAVLLVDVGWNPVISLVIVFFAGSLAGLLTGSLHVKLGMSKLLSGISVAAMLYSGSLLVMSGRASVSMLDKPNFFSLSEKADLWFNSFLSVPSRYFLHPATIITAAAVVLIFYSVSNRLLNSEFGVVLRGIGMNESGMRFYGRTTGGYKIAGVAFANGLAALSGSLGSQFQGFADVNMGIGILVSSLVAVMLGLELFSRFRISLNKPIMIISASLSGTIVYQVLMSGIMALGAPPISLRFLSGFLLVVIIALGSSKREIAFKW